MGNLADKLKNMARNAKNEGSNSGVKKLGDAKRSAEKKGDASNDAKSSGRKS